MKKVLLIGIVLLFFCSCSSFLKSDISGGKVSVEKNGVVVSAEIVKKEECKTCAENAE